ncbi:MAG: hypothetical protein FWF01_04860 [Alphaproteobacteria bacterium]|nr:hypothetical protein [Alphaproteobacteria bacterium]
MSENTQQGLKDLQKETAAIINKKFHMGVHDPDGWKREKGEASQYRAFLYANEERSIDAGIAKAALEGETKKKYHYTHIVYPLYESQEAFETEQEAAMFANKTIPAMKLSELCQNGVYSLAFADDCLKYLNPLSLTKGR